MNKKRGEVQREEIVKQFEKTLRTWNNLSKYHRDYILMKEVYHCSPHELDKVEEWRLNLDYSFLMSERKHEMLEQKRAEQKAKLKK